MFRKFLGIFGFFKAWFCELLVIFDIFSLTKMGLLVLLLFFLVGFLSKSQTGGKKENAGGTIMKNKKTSKVLNEKMFLPS